MNRPPAPPVYHKRPMGCVMWTLIITSSILLASLIIALLPVIIPAVIVVFMIFVKAIGG